jgi:sensor c-di-GMP phosphodiesterase-like protein
VVAEGVETAIQRDWLRANGCDFGQGWLYGRPLPAEAQTAAFTQLTATG